MAKKEVMVGFKISPKEKEKLYNEAAELGFLKGGGKPNFSSFCRSIFKLSKYPLSREIYADLITVNRNLIALGGLYNQTIYNINRERVILNDKGFHNENNKFFLKKIHSLNAQLLAMDNELKKMKSVMQNIINIEGA